MDAREKTPEGSEIIMSENQRVNGTEVVLTIDPNEGTGNGSTESKDLKESPSFKSSCPSPEEGVYTSADKPPKVPNEALIRRRSSKSLYSRQKSRFGEQPYPLDVSVFEAELARWNSPSRSPVQMASHNNKSTPSTPNALPITPKTPLMASAGPAGGVDDDDDEIYKKVTLELSKKKHRKVRIKALVEWLAFGCMLGCLIASLRIERLQNVVLWSIELWKWCALVMVIFSGLLVTNWIMHFIVFLIERKFLLRKKVLYFVHGLKKSVQVFIWLSLVLLTWILLFKLGSNRAGGFEKMLNYVMWTLTSILIGSFLWFLKTLFLKILASNFHVTTFFDRIQESIFHHYILQTLSGPPLVEEAEKSGRQPSTGGQFSLITSKKGKPGKEKKVIDMWKIHKMKQEKVTAWTMKMLIDAVTNSGLTTISNTLDETEHDREAEKGDKEIKSVMEATVAAYLIFNNVARKGHKYIEEDDLRRFMIKEEVEYILPLFEEVSETGKIDLQALIDWVVKVYQGRKALAHALTDTKTAVRQLNKLVTGILIVVTIIIWLLLTEIATTKVILLLTSQLLVAGFIFGNACRTIFEAIIFVFVMHPFDVGDRCVIDGVPLLVEEMNILSTVFLKLNSEKVYYPNSVLATKPISNYQRSPDMGDVVGFSIDFMTPLERIGELKERIRKYLEETAQYWHPNHNVVVNEIENVNKIKMTLYVNHRMNFQDFVEKNKRRTELVLEMKRIFHELNIRYYLLPQQVHLYQKDEEASSEGKPLAH